MFEPRKDVSLFRQARVGRESRTVEWPNGADLAPEFLYETGRTFGPGTRRFDGPLIPSRIIEVLASSSPGGTT